MIFPSFLGILPAAAPATYGLTSVKAEPGEVLGVGPETLQIRKKMELTPKSAGEHS